MRASQILPYTEFMEKGCAKAFETYFSEGIDISPEQCYMKRQKLSETQSKPTFKSCKVAK